MTLKLIFKQSYHYFKSKGLLYLTFIPFLILVVSLIVGMFSFAYNFQVTYHQTLGTNVPNFKLFLERPFKPAWVGNQFVDDYYLIQEKENPQTQQGYFYDFMLDFWTQDEENIPSLEESQLLILGLGYHGGEAKELTLSDVLTNKLLKEYFQDKTFNEPLITYNVQVNKLAKKLYRQYQTNNLISAYFLDFIQKNEGWLSHTYREYRNVDFVSPVVKEQMFWKYLIVGPDLIPTDPTFYEETPWSLRTNPAIPYQVQKKVNWNDYSEFLKNRNFLYFSPKFLHNNHLKVGQIVRINFDLTITGQLLEEEQGEEFLIAGTLVNSNNFDYHKQNFFVPYQWINKYYQDHNLMPPNSRGHIYAHFPKFGNDWQTGQKFASSLFNEHFSNLKEPGVLLETETEWAEWLPIFSFKITVILFLVLAYFVSFLLIFLLVGVFYFITKQIVVFQKQTLMFLKSLGVSNHQLSILVTATLIIPLSSTLIGGFFGGLAIQQFTANLALQTTSLYWDYFNFNLVFFLAWIFVIVILTIIFYIVNLILIKRQSLISTQGQGSQIEKVMPHWWTQLKMNLPNSWSPKFKIGLSFAFKNLIQNLVTYLLLTITFSITLYAVQFKTSLESLGRSYEKWNAPYQSVNYNSQLYLYSPNENQEFLRTYQTRTMIDDLTPINDFKDWNQYFVQYLQTVGNENFTFNWQDYYLTKSFSLDVLDLINDAKRFDEAVKQFQEKLNDVIHDPEEVERFLILFLNLVEQLKIKVTNLIQEFHYNEGFNLYFGQVPLLANNRIVWVSESLINDQFKSSNLVAFRQSDSDSQKHFGFDQYSKASDYWWKSESGKGFLRVNISNYLATKNNYHEGQNFKLTIKGLKSDLSSQNLTLPIHVEKIIQDNNVTPEIYTCQEGLLNYLTKMPELSDKAKSVYEDLYSQLIQGTDQIGNSVYDADGRIPWGIQNLTLPLYHVSGFEKGGKAGTRLEDFYDPILVPHYFEKLGSEIFIFDEVSRKALKSSEQFLGILNHLIIIFCILSIIISAILTNLILFENQRIIVLLKSMGYRRKEVEWYLIGGYFIATLLAVGSGIGFSFLIFQLTKQVLTAQLGFSIYFIWSWQYILTFLGLGLIFWAMVKITTSLFTKQQKPTNLFEEY